MHGILHLLVAGAVGLFVFLFSLIALLVYLLPTWIAHARGTKSRWWITTLNVLFGWSLIGWFVTLIWSWKDARLRPVYHGVEIHF